MGKDSDIAAIKEMLKHYAVCLNKGDLNSWMSMWADEGIQLPHDAPIRIGKKQIRDGMKPLFDLMPLDIAITSIEDVKVHGDLGLSVCTYTLKITPETGGEMIDAMPDAKALTFYQRQSDGSWKIAYDCFNSSVSPT